MTKSAITNDEIQILINRMSLNDKDAILLGAKSDVAILNLNSVLFGAKYKYTVKEYIDILRTKLLDSKASFMGTPLKTFVTAALDVLNVQKYSGTDSEIRKLINSNFDFD